MIDLNRRVYVYFNLHKKIWSVRQIGTPVEHTKYIMLKDAKFLVSEAGRQKVLREQRKNVHAGVSGYIVERVPNVPDAIHNVTYNPYKYRSFVSIDTDPFRATENVIEPIFTARKVIITDKVWAQVKVEHKEN